MTIQEKSRLRYESGDTPWDTGRPDKNLVQVATDRPIEPCSALEIGCGYGHNAIWLSKQGFTVTALDVSEIAIEKAKENADRRGVECNFRAADFLDETAPGSSFELVFDRGCFHLHDTPLLRKSFARVVAKQLSQGGLWLSLVGSADDPPRDTGPPRRTAGEIVDAAEPYFEILSLTSGVFDSNRKRAPRIWVCLMRQRKQ
ncbi:MAG: class I SAM-dependent methyltransferase [Deltaproteobacteria bacterium]|nr:class I SAM-dependent methyltransferase [Deltaproteobacteria bacterium]